MRIVRRVTSGSFAIVTHSSDQELILREDDEYQMAVRSDDIGLPDPLVAPYWQDWDDADSVWQVDGHEPDFPAVRDFALFHLLNECHGTAGRVEVQLSDADLDRVLADLADAFPPPTRLNGREVFERPGILALVYTPADGRVRVTASVQRRVSKNEVPECLFHRRAGCSCPSCFRGPTRRTPADCRRTRGTRRTGSGSLFRFGRDDRPEDNAEAVRWYRISADRGHAGATNDLAYMFECGHGVAKDVAEAVHRHPLPPSGSVQ